MRHWAMTQPRLDPWLICADDYPEDGYSSDQLEFLLGYGILAPSNHNAQPWLFRLHVSEVDVIADRRRALRIIDPADRELTLSCGSVLFNLRVAAEYFGHQCGIQILPQRDDPNLMARVHLGLKADTPAEDVVLFHAIQQRRTSRHPFQPEPLPDECLAALAGAAESEGAWLHLFTEESPRMEVADLVAEADRIQWADRHFREEMSRWIRPRSDPALDGIPVHDLGIRDWLSFAGPLLVRTFDRGDGQAARDRDIAMHSPVLAVLGTNADDCASWLAAGQALEHVLLKAQSENVTASFLSQPVEIPALRARLTEMTGRAGFAQVLLRLGCAPAVSPAPRRPLRAMVIQQSHSHG
ncbi:MAG TPA: nitroreductase [Candidatus Paceibacterota bacterium]|nr:nitroreductase [Verrucomicrobiota bacterium]HRZ46125.1 nitroreductase [Candidatus Paceibacterota bacterium]HRZ93442.1 nitroreductase [Candidatus Paceibacterota bacterium]